MKEYRIALVWEMWGHITVEAESEEEARALALGPAPLPEGRYVDDSVAIDEEAGIEVSEISEA